MSDTQDLPDVDGVTHGRRVLARFFVGEVNKKAYGGGEPQREVVLQAATRGEENKSWARYTPSGRITLTVNGPAGMWFEAMLGKDVAITFAEAAEAEPTKYGPDGS